MCRWSKLDVNQHYFRNSKQNELPESFSYFKNLFYSNFTETNKIK